MYIDILIIATAIGALGTITGAIIATYKVMMGHIDKRLDVKLAPLAKWTESQQADINLAAERDALMMEAQLVSMEAIHECKFCGESAKLNIGNVDGAMSKLRQYMLTHSSKPSSHA